MLLLFILIIPPVSFPADILFPCPLFQLIFLFQSKLMLQFTNLLYKSGLVSRLQETQLSFLPSFAGIFTYNYASTHSTSALVKDSVFRTTHQVKTNKHQNKTSEKPAKVKWVVPHIRHIIVGCGFFPLLN